MVRPPCLLVNSFSMRPSSTATTGVPRGARMSMASWTWPVRPSAKLSRSVLRSMPASFHHLLELGARDRKRHAGTQTANHVEHTNVVERLR